MAKVTNVYVKINQSEINAILKGPAAQDLDRRGTAVLNGAKKRCPVDTGQLRSSLNKELVYEGDTPVVHVGTNLKHGIFVHEGTGVYGPKGVPITPKTAKFLVFKPRGSSTTVFARQVRGVKPRPFLKDALADAKS